ncbi:MAG: hypothetical protein ISS49_16520 [Anaerolineae bacterium]|nr:hypothetical protein [Anaerolineae bacterium]
MTEDRVDHRAQGRAADAAAQDRDVVAPELVPRESLSQWCAHADHISHVHAVQGIGDCADAVDGELDRLTAFPRGGDAKSRYLGELSRLIVEIRAHCGIVYPDLEKLDACRQIAYADYRRQIQYHWIEG